MTQHALFFNLLSNSKSPIQIGFGTRRQSAVRNFAVQQWQRGWWRSNWHGVPKRGGRRLELGLPNAEKGRGSGTCDLHGRNQAARLHNPGFVSPHQPQLPHATKLAFWKMEKKDFYLWFDKWKQLHKHCVVDFQDRTRTGDLLLDSKLKKKV